VVAVAAGRCLEAIRHLEAQLDAARKPSEVREIAGQLMRAREQVRRLKERTKPPEGS
jgi:hypothetical protein